MAAPALARLVSIGFRDSKGQTSRTTIIIGGATNAAIDTAVASWGTVTAAVSNASAYFVQDPSQIDKRQYGTTATYATVEDKMVLTFYGSNGALHRFQYAAPKAAGFLADQETVNQAETNVNALLVFISANCYGTPLDTSPLVFVGGYRLRRKMHRKVNIFTLNPALTGPDE